MKKIYLLLAIAAIAISCEKSEIEDVIKTKSISVTVNSASAATRVNVSEGADNTWNVDWTEGDAVSVYVGNIADGINDKDQKGKIYPEGSIFYGKGLRPVTFEMTNFAKDASTFSGDISGDASIIRLVYPVQNDDNSAFNKISSNNFRAEFLNSTLAASSDLSGLSKTTYMISNIVKIDGTEITSTPTMRHITAGIELKMKFESAPSQTLLLTNIAVGSTDAETEAGEGINIASIVKMDISSEDIEPIYSAGGILNIKADKFEATNDVYTLYYNTFPFDVATGEYLQFAATFVDANGIEYSSTGKLENEGAELIKIVEGTKNTFYVQLSAPVLVN